MDVILPFAGVCGAPSDQLSRPVSALPSLVGPRCDRCGTPTVHRPACTSAPAAARLRLGRARRLRPVGRGSCAPEGARPADARSRSGGRRGGPLAPPPWQRSRSSRRSRARPRARAHPAERLARELGERWSLPCRHSSEGPRLASRQRGLSLADRRRNVAGAFAPPAKRRPVALVDDVYTSGSTANAAATALRKAGARRVDVITFARVVR